jgi:hypothetical protein
MASPLSAPGRLALPVRHRLRFRHLPGRLGRRPNLHMKVSDSYKIQVLTFGLLAIAFRIHITKSAKIKKIVFMVGKCNLVQMPE